MKIPQAKYRVSFWISLLVISYMVWAYSLEIPKSEADNLYKIIQNDKTVFQLDTDRIKICFLTQFVLAPEIIRFELPVDSTSLIRIISLENREMFNLKIKTN